MQADLLNTLHKNRTFSDMVMRICINIVKVQEDNEVDGFLILVPAGRMVYNYPLS
jgi:hypothetical protein